MQFIVPTSEFKEATVSCHGGRNQDRELLAEGTKNDEATERSVKDYMGVPLGVIESCKQ